MESWASTVSFFFTQSGPPNATKYRNSSFEVTHGKLCGGDDSTAFVRAVAVPESYAAGRVPDLI
jgi:hypothetical protein